MLLDISMDAFRNVFCNEEFFLPKRWDGVDYQDTLKQLYAKYLKQLQTMPSTITQREVEQINKLCTGILLSIDRYFKGYPSQALDELSNVMNILIRTPIALYEKSSTDNFFEFRGDSLKLFRVRNVQQNLPYQRTDIFHTPYNIRSKVAPYRYSIAGYPSLYLGTSLALCGEESKKSALNDFTIASRFEFVRDRKKHNYSIRVIDLAVKPQDFLLNHVNMLDQVFEPNKRNIDMNVSDPHTRSSYVLWYPLIAACSYIRVSKADPFAAEYVIPQLLMQWVRCKNEENELFGIRYFSCASIKASDMGFNYVFPVSGRKYRGNTQYCDVLSKVFKLTSPKFSHEYESISEWELSLITDRNAEYIFTTS